MIKTPKKRRSNHKANYPQRKRRILEAPIPQYHKPLEALKMYRQTLYSVSNITSKLPDKMGASAPVEVGTRGTVGSLLKKEIEYFRRHEIDCCRSSQRNVPEFASGGGNSWPSFRFLNMAYWRRKKRRGSGVRPGICSMVEVADSHRLNEIPGFSYRSLRIDSKEFEISSEIV